MRWHIDYFLKNRNCLLTDILVIEGKKAECSTAKKIMEFSVIPAIGFGSSDCNCSAHFFRIEKNSLFRLVSLSL